MNFVIQKISNYGTKHPVVARLAPQTIELMNWSNLPKEDKTVVLELYINTLKPRILRCYEISEKLKKSLEDSRAMLQPQTDPRVHNAPAIIGLQSEVESFLYEVKNFLRDLLGIFEIFFKANLKDARVFYPEKSKQDSKLVLWAAEKFGDEDELTKLLRTEQNWIRQWIEMRNAIEHPGGYSGTLTINNVRLYQGSWLLPTWSRDGLPEADIFIDMQTAQHNMLTLAEELLAICVQKTIFAKGIFFYEVPKNERNPECPQRLRVGLDRSYIKSTS